MPIGHALMHLLLYKNIGLWQDWQLLLAGPEQVRQVLSQGEHINPFG